ncbi:hypothetical protein CKM354_000147500 [Cercospora kikuchii]|uniref:Uncharacterized protein n=1 Tax=Cercospora kikuchii TaxID=84275 RepID=A0A9P3C842_9PEZI|nr:uncharacterized protein CKM354_000147500 [Cercospora kikuchii]GIZ38048.1 hypothetical protein CKM354_000147500 [Cercospora kikuchii]
MPVDENTSSGNEKAQSSAECTGVSDNCLRHNSALGPATQPRASEDLRDERSLCATSANQMNENTNQTEDTNQMDADTIQSDASATGTHASQPKVHYVFDCDTSRPITIITGTGTDSDPKVAYTIAAELLERHTSYFPPRCFDESPEERVFELSELPTTLFAHYLGFVTGSLKDFSAHAREQAQARAALSGISGTMTPLQFDVFTLQAHSVTWFFGDRNTHDFEYCNAIMDAIFQIENLGAVVVECMDEWHRLAMTSEEMWECLWRDTPLTSLMADCILGFLSEQELYRKIGEKVWWEAAFLRKLVLRRLVLGYEGKEVKVPSWDDRETYYQRYPQVSTHVPLARDNVERGSRWRG